METLVADLAVAYSQRDADKVEEALKPILACPAVAAAALLSLLDIQVRTEAVVRQVALEALQAKPETVA